MMKYYPILPFRPEHKPLQSGFRWDCKLWAITNRSTVCCSILHKTEAIFQNKRLLQLQQSKSSLQKYKDGKVMVEQLNFSVRYLWTLSGSIQTLILFSIQRWKGLRELSLYWYHYGSINKENPNRSTEWWQDNGRKASTKKS